MFVYTFENINNIKNITINNSIGNSNRVLQVVFEYYRFLKNNYCCCGVTCAFAFRLSAVYIFNKILKFT